MVDRRPTIADVAQRAGVSKGLVSFVVNNRPGVAADTRARILAVADEMGWRPRPNARSLSTRRSSALGWVVRREPDVVATDPFFPAFMAGVESVLADHGQVLVLSLVSDAVAEQRAYRTLVADARVDGVFLTDLHRADDRLALVAELGLPAIAIGRPDAHQELPTVDLDDTHGVAQSVEHLVELGHRRIGYVAGDISFVHGYRRRAAYASSMERAELSAGPIVLTDFSAAGGAAATSQILDTDPRPTAVVYANDVMAIAGMGLLQQRGLRVPEDMSVTGFDGAALGRYTYPALTTVVADPMAWGRTAAEVLLQLITEGHAPSVELAPAQLVVRTSTGRPTP
jgi:DNA-binding LacI/PurR family transcriptional regulator